MARNAIPGRKNTILNAALLLFAKKGYALSSMADIARTANVAVGTVYLYFENKDEVLAACAERFHHEHILEVERILSSPASASEKLQTYLLSRFRKWQQETTGAKKGTDLALAMVQISPHITRQEEKLWISTLTKIIDQGVQEKLFQFSSRAQEFQIFHFNLVAYFPLPGSSHPLKPTEKNLVQMIQWFCKKWSRR